MKKYGTKQLATNGLLACEITDEAHDKLRRGESFMIDYTICDTMSLSDLTRQGNEDKYLAIGTTHQTDSATFEQNWVDVS